MLREVGVWPSARKALKGWSFRPQQTGLAAFFFRCGNTAFCQEWKLRKEVVDHALRWDLLVLNEGFSIFPQCGDAQKSLYLQRFYLIL